MMGRPVRFGANRFLQVMLALYAAIWVVLAIRPVDRADWFLENLLVFTAVAVLSLTYRKFQFSNFSYLLLAIFLVLHAVGAHYTYAKVPAGFWLADMLHFERNHFDRLIHFAFGLLLAYPLREVLLRSAGAKVRWAPALAFIAIIAMSSFFEIIEAVIAQLVYPELGSAYLGTQGDIWDAQKDMIAAFFGAVVATALGPLLPRVATDASSR